MCEWWQRYLNSLWTMWGIVWPIVPIGVDYITLIKLTNKLYLKQSLNVCLYLYTLSWHEKVCGKVFVRYRKDLIRPSFSELSSKCFYLITELCMSLTDIATCNGHLFNSKLKKKIVCTRNQAWLYFGLYY